MMNIKKIIKEEIEDSVKWMDDIPEYGLRNELEDLLKKTNRDEQPQGIFYVHNGKPLFIHSPNTKLFFISDDLVLKPLSKKWSTNSSQVYEVMGELLKNNYGINVDRFYVF